MEVPVAWQEGSRSSTVPDSRLMSAADRMAAAFLCSLNQRAQKDLAAPGRYGLMTLTLTLTPDADADADA